MWFKRVLLGYCAASLAVTITTASTTKDAALLKRHHTIERLSFPTLERRQQPAGNQTSSSEASEPTSSVTFSSAFESSDVLTSSTIVQIPTEITTFESTLTSASVPTSSAEDSVSSTSNGDAVSSSRLISTVSTASLSSATQQPSNAPTQPTPTSLQSEASTSSLLSSVVDITSIMTSSVDETQSSSTFELPSSVSEPVFEPTPTVPESISSAEVTSSTLPTSASVPAEETAQPPPDSATSLASDSATTSTVIESVHPSVPATSTQTFTQDTIVTASATPSASSVDSAPTTTPVEQQSTAVSESSTTSQVPVIPESSNIPQELPTFSIISSLPADPSSIPQELPTISVVPSLPVESSGIPQELPTSSAISSLPLEPSSVPQELPTVSEPAPVSTSIPTLSSPGDQSSSADETRFSTSELQSTTVAAISSTEMGSSAQTLSPSMVPSSPLPSTIGPDPTPTQEEISTGMETLGPSSVTSALETVTTPVESIPQPPLSSSSDQSLSSIFSEPTPIITDALSSLAPSVITSSQLAAVTSLLQTGDSLSSVQLPSSSLLGVSSGIDEMSTAPTLITSSENIDISSAATTVADTMPASSISIISTQTEPLPAESNGPISSLPDVVSTGSAAPSSSIAITPSFTLIGSETAMSTPEIPISTGDPTASVILSGSSGSDTLPSFVPSETLVTSAIASAVSSSEGSTGLPLISSSLTFVLSSAQPSPSEQPSTATFTPSLPTLSMGTPSDLSSQSQASSTLRPGSTGTFLSLTLDELDSPTSSLVSGSPTSSSQNPTSVAGSTTDTMDGPIPTSESSSSNSTLLSSKSTFGNNPTHVSASSFASSVVSTITGASGMPLPSSVISNGTQTQPSVSFSSGIITATFSTVYISTVRSSALDMSTVAFSLFSSVTEAAVNQTNIRTSSAISATVSSGRSSIGVPASESLTLSTKPNPGANSTWSSPMGPSLTATASLPGGLNSTATSTAELGITFSRSVLPTDVGTAPTSNGTEMEALETSSMQSAVNSTVLGPIASTTSDSAFSTGTEFPSSTSTSGSDEASALDTGGSDGSKTVHAPTDTPSQTAVAGPPPLTNSQTAGVAVGATTGLLIAVVAAIFLARRHHAAKYGKRASTGSVYPKVAYLYDPKTGGDDGDAEALMSGGTGESPPGSSAARAGPGPKKHMQRHSTGTMPTTRFANPGNPLGVSVHDPAAPRYSEYALLDTARALSAAVAGYGAAARHSTSFIRYRSGDTDVFSNHVIPSPTFAPFSPDDIRRPELKSPRSATDDRGEYSRMSISSYAYLNTAASMYPPISPYGRPSAQGPSPFSDPRRHTLDSNPYADPFEHDLPLQVDERNRTSDSVTVFAGSPNLMSPRTPRTPVGPKLPVNQPDGMSAARSLLSPVAKYMHQAQEVKIPQKSVGSPVLVQVGRSPVIKPFSPPPAAPEPRGWDDIKRLSEKRFSDEESVPQPLKFASPVVQRKPVATGHVRTKPSLTGAGHTLLAGNGLPLTVNIPHMYKKSVGLDVPRVHARPDPAHEVLSSDPVVREKRSRELRFADPALIGKEF